MDPISARLALIAIQARLEPAAVIITEDHGPRPSGEQAWHRLLDLKPRSAACHEAVGCAYGALAVAAALLDEVERLSGEVPQ